METLRIDEFNEGEEAQTLRVATDIGAFLMQDETTGAPEYVQMTIDDIELTPMENADFAKSIEVYLAKHELKSVLRDHQVEVFEDLMTFFIDGAKRGFINLPTGTGKTVLFVELAKAMLEQLSGKEAPRILVVTPTKDLVHQTLGRNGEKGFGQFAPLLDVGSFFSDTSDRERRKRSSNDVTVTTYQSFEILCRQQPVPIEIGNKKAPQDKKKTSSDDAGLIRDINDYDIIILDEAHHALSPKTSKLIQSLPESTTIIGFTATPDIDENNELTSVLPYKIHELGLTEAITMNLLAPIVPIGVESGVVIKGSNLYDANGEFIDSRISYLAQDARRNRIILNAAKTLVDQNIPTIISCIAGNEAEHARYLAAKLCSEGVSAAAVHGKMSAKDRQMIYAQYNKGEIDVLTFIGVLGEGWDSPRAKGLINARPTRSHIFSKQRPGRIARSGATAFAIDIFDSFEGPNPPITMTDVLELESVEIGHYVGNPSDEERIQTVIGQLQNSVPVMPELRGTFSEYSEYIRSLPSLERGTATTEMGGHFALPTRITSAYAGMTEEIIQRYEELNDVVISKREALQGKGIRTVYHISEAKDMIYGFPLVTPERYYVDKRKERWLGAQGLAQLFSNRYPDVTTEVIDNVLMTYGHSLDWIPARMVTSPKHVSNTRYRVIKMYSASPEAINVVNGALREYFEQQIIDTTINRE
ncbi:MAG: DEAD/DEAH box helicase [Candidatus Saccharibacteria bacterium]